MNSVPNDHVIVIGGGDTAIDAARVSLRLVPDAAAVSRRMGAEVTILYRRTRAEMPAEEDEFADAIAEGVTIDYLIAPTEVLKADGRVRGLRCVQMELGQPDDSGRPRPVPIAGWCAREDSNPRPSGPKPDALSS